MQRTNTAAFFSNTSWCPCIRLWVSCVALRAAYFFDTGTGTTEIPVTPVQVVSFLINKIPVLVTAVLASSILRRTFPQASQCRTQEDRGRGGYRVASAM